MKNTLKHKKFHLGMFWGDKTERKVGSKLIYLINRYETELEEAVNEIGGVHLTGIK